MSGQLFKFAVKDLRPRRFGLLGVWGAVIGPTFGHLIWLFNWVRINLRILLLFVFAAFVFTITFTAVDLLIEYGFSNLHKFKELLLCSRTSLLDDSSIFPLLGKFFSGVAHSLHQTPIYGIAITYFIARFVQHVFDWRGWHATWFTEHWDRFRAKLGYPGRCDFPVLILGRGGSGKSTLAKILQYGFVRRQIFRPAGFQYEGNDESVVVRDPKNDIGGPVGKYNVTWRPDLYKVGRLAAAYDMPGQIVDDWIKAIKLVNDRRRVAIIYPVTNGYNATIRKFELEQCNPKNPSEFIIDPKYGKIYGIANNISDNYKKYSLSRAENNSVLTVYRQHIMRDEYNSFEKIVEAIEENWVGNIKPKLLLIHVVNMADLWTSHHKKDKWRDTSRAVLAHYDIKAVYKKFRSVEGLGVSEDEAKPFYLLNQRLIDHLGKKNVSVKVLPAAFHSGKRTHDAYDKFAIFDSEYEFEPEEYEARKESVPNFDERMRKTVEKKEILGRTSVKTIRAIRLALYRAYSEDWSDRSRVGETYAVDGHGKKKQTDEKDLYDVWREAEAQR